MQPYELLHQAPLFCSLPLGFPRQEQWSGLSSPSPGDLPDPVIKSESPALGGGFFTTEPHGLPLHTGAAGCASLLGATDSYFSHNAAENWSEGSEGMVTKF